MASEHTALTAQEWLRYQRHLQLPQFSAAGQLALKAAHVLIVGMGGLGCPVAQYLAAAGVGKLTLVDADTVSLSNLQRQILYSCEDVGIKKVVAARQRLTALNDAIAIETVIQQLSLQNAPALIQQCDLVVDCSDNFATRYLINDLCIAKQKPWIYGSVLGFAGQLALFVPGGACFRCLFPEASDVADCNQAGVLGVMPGTIGLLQATEVIKYLAQLRGSLADKLLLVEGLTAEYRTIQLTRSSDCKVCTQEQTVTDRRADYQMVGASAMVQDYELPPAQFKACLHDRAYQLIDVREHDEHAVFNIGGSVLPLQKILKGRHALHADEKILLYCQSGKRSEQAALYLRNNGIVNVHSLAGGMAALLSEQ